MIDDRTWNRRCLLAATNTHEKHRYAPNGDVITFVGRTLLDTFFV